MTGLMRQRWERLRGFFRRRELDRDFDHEAQSHIALAVEDYLRRGMPVAEAERLARMTFGAVEASKDAHRDSRGLPWLEGLVHDLRFAVRGLWRDRAFTATAIAMLTLALALNVTVFTVMDAFLFRGYPLVKENERVVYLKEQFPGGRCCISYPDFESWRAQAAGAFEDMAFVGQRPVSLRDGDGPPVETAACTVSAHAFRVLGVSPMLGRDFVPEDEAPGAPAVAILNYRFWESRFGKRTDTVGATIQINGAPATVIGVMPPRFEFPTRYDLWMPVVRTQELQERGISQGYIAVGRLKDGVTIDQARTGLETINRRLAVDYPENKGIVPMVHTHAAMVSGPDAPTIWGSLWVGAWFVLFIACANLANLSLVRTMVRWRDFSTRIALGAGLWRMVRHIALETLMLTGVAGALAWVIVKWSVQRWTAATESMYQILDYSIDGGTLAYLVAVSAAVTILCALPPTARVLQLGVGGALKGDARGVTQGLRGKRLSGALIAAQMALAIVLLAGAGVLGRSFFTIVSAETGIHDPEHVLVGRVRLPSENYAGPSQRLAYFDRLDAELKTIPGIQEISIANNVPIRGAALRVMELEGQPARPDADRTAMFFTVGSRYFEVMGAPVMSGRDFTDADRAATSKVAIVNERFAALYWPGQQPIGKRLRNVDGRQPGEWHTVVGVAPNIRQGDALRQGFKPLVYVAAGQYPMRVGWLFVRTLVPPGSLAQAVRAALHRLEPDVAFEDVKTLKAGLGFERDFMDPEHSELGKHAAVAPVFAAIAVLLAAIGLSAVIGHSVSQRTKEIGVRMAIGAGVKDIRRMVLREGMMPVFVGMVIGAAAALAVNRALQSQLVGVSPYDPLTMTAAPAILFVVAVLACRIPARKATNVEPVVALRHE